MSVCMSKSISLHLQTNTVIVERLSACVRAFNANFGKYFITIYTLIFYF